MISESQIHFASTAFNCLQRKGSSFFQEFIKINFDKISELEVQIASDESSFRGYSLERKRMMINTFAVGMLYISTLSEEDKSCIGQASQKQLMLEKKRIKSAIYL
ncbi:MULTISPECIES: hypothetical protein [unclassified Synechococcus]|uniref:hypothetical protein n=1 Tax=unclassified Synechococcus TaxID=2626047 RepID=UPI001CF87C9A|nr:MULTISPECIES: hypothetical protein [unclassified Synechococcus]MCB4412311.1 hypothetical protein [Synechococcus sp. MU1611]